MEGSVLLLARPRVRAGATYGVLLSAWLATARLAMLMVVCMSMRVRCGWREEEVEASAGVTFQGAAEMPTSVVLLLLLLTKNGFLEEPEKDEVEATPGKKTTRGRRGEGQTDRQTEAKISLASGSGEAKRW